MDEKRSIFKVPPINWQWVLVGYCFFVVFHLLPSFLLFGFSKALLKEELPAFIWFFLGLGIVSFFIGYKSRGVTIIEPAIAALLYTLTLIFEFGTFSARSLSLRNVGALYVWTVVVLVLTLTGAWIGELVQARRARIAAKKEP